MRRVIVIAALALVVAWPARASERPTGWDGTNPFNCVLQNAGFGPTGPDPGADPYCIEFDKRHQNIAEGGFVDFVSKEPARSAAAVPKCFYFQSDHWRGSVVQDDGSTKTYEWDGHYFFDKATGDGGVWVTNFNINGHSGDPSEIPGIPADIAKDFGNGTGGVITRNEFPADPNCAARAKKEPDKIYAHSTRPAGDGNTPTRPACVGGGGVTSRSLGPVALGTTEGRVRQALGPPADVVRGTLRYCAASGKRFVAGERGDRSGDLGSGDAARIVLVLSDGRAYALHGVHPGSKASALKRAFPRSRTLARVGTTRMVAARRRSGVLFGVRRGRVHWIAVYDRHAVHTARGARLLAQRALAG
jgi:hypothetical protein